jgi:hypothetical protein
MHYWSHRLFRDVRIKPSSRQPDDGRVRVGVPVLCVHLLGHKADVAHMKPHTPEELEGWILATVAFFIMALGPFFGLLCLIGKVCV